MRKHYFSARLTLSIPIDITEFKPSRKKVMVAQRSFLNISEHFIVISIRGSL